MNLIMFVSVAEIALLLLVLHTFTAFGLAYAAGHSKISLPLRMHFSNSFATVRCTGCGLLFLATPAWNGRVHVCPGCRRQYEDIDRVEPFLLQLIECPACFGWWIGFFTGLILECFPLLHPSHARWQLAAALLLPFVLAFYTAGTNYLLGRATGLIQS